MAHCSGSAARQQRKATLTDDYTATSSGHESPSHCNSSCSCSGHEESSSSRSEHSSDDASSSPSSLPSDRRGRVRRKRSTANKVAPMSGKANRGRHASSAGRYSQPSLGIVQFMDNGHPGQPVHLAGAYPPAPQPPHLLCPPQPDVRGGPQNGGSQRPLPLHQSHFSFPSQLNALPPHNAAGMQPPPPQWNPPPLPPGMQATQYLQPTNSASAIQPSWVLLEAQLRAASLHDIIHRKLLPKRKELLQQVEAVETRGNEVRAACRETAAQVRQSTEEQLRRLTALETSKLAALQRQGDALKADLEAIRHVLCESSVAVGNDAVNAGLQLPRLNAIEDAATALSEKAFSSEVATSADGFEELVQDYEELMERHCSLAKLLHVKDEMIWKLLDERSALQRQLTEAKRSAVSAAEPREDVVNSAGAASAMDPTIDRLPCRNFGVPESTAEGSRAVYGVSKTCIDGELKTAAHRSDSLWVSEATLQPRSSVANGSSTERSRCSVPPRVSSSTEGYATDIEGEAPEDRSRHLREPGLLDATGVSHQTRPLSDTQSADLLSSIPSQALQHLPMPIT